MRICLETNNVLKGRRHTGSTQAILAGNIKSVREFILGAVPLSSKCSGLGCTLRMGPIAPAVKRIGTITAFSALIMANLFYNLVCSFSDDCIASKMEVLPKFGISTFQILGQARCGAN